MSPKRSSTPILAAIVFAMALIMPTAAMAATVRVQDDDPHLRWVGPHVQVARAYASLASRRTLSPGSSVEMAFTGTSAAWLGPVAPRYGTAKVYVDGALAATVNTAATRSSERCYVWRSGTLASGPHTVRIVAVGRVAVDALEADGAVDQVVRPHSTTRLDERSSRVVFTDLCTTSYKSWASGGSMRWSALNGTGVTMRFDGTDIALIGPRWPRGGKARIYIDGLDRGIVSQYAPTTYAQRVIYARGGLSDGAHTLRVVALGAKDPLGKGTSVAIDAFDIAGTALQATDRLNEDDRRVGYRGSWRSAGAATSGWGETASSRRGSQARVSFRGSRIALVATKGPSAGYARIWLDGVDKGYVDLYASSTKRGTAVWTSPALSDGRHTLVVGVAGTKNPASRGARVAVDGFRVDGVVIVPPASSGHARLESGSSLCLRAGSWSSATSDAHSGHSTLVSNRKGARYFMEFTGTGFTWFATKTRSGGAARVYVDGKSVGTVSLYTPGASQPRRAVFQYGGLTERRHRVVIEVLGYKERASQGTYVNVDFLDCAGHFEQAKRPAPFNYPWMNYIVIDKSECNLYWVKDGSLKKVYRCAVGKASTQTPVGIWRIGAKYYTDPGGIYGPRKMRMYRKVGSSFQYTAYNIHGTNQEWVIGTWASHGCIRMYNRQVLELFPQVSIGTMVVTKD